MGSVILIAFVWLHLAACVWLDSPCYWCGLKFLAAVMDLLYRGIAQDAKRIRAMILSDDVMIIALITGQKPMKLMWNRKNVTRYDYC